uniref:Uncharacterized protein n=1 Tax=Salix viminalis TaxID=40686 RepID=A0A6N2NM95_SALVM
MLYVEGFESPDLGAEKSRHVTLNESVDLIRRWKFHCKRAAIESQLRQVLFGCVKMGMEEEDRSVKMKILKGGGRFWRWSRCIMGCNCCKPSAIEDSKESPRERLSNKASSDLRVSRATSSRREEA